MRKQYHGTAFYRLVANSNGTQRIVVAFAAQKISQRTAAYVSGDFASTEQQRELARAQHAVGVRELRLAA